MPPKKTKLDLVVPAFASLPVDIIINHLFVKLPVINVIRCRSVCKQWLRLLSDPYFISIHFKHQSLNNNQKILCGPILYKERLPGDSKEDYHAKRRAFHGVFYSLHLQSSSRSVDVVRLQGFPLLDKNYLLFRTIGYGKGLVCMIVCKYRLKGALNSFRILIGNPSTGDYKILPEPRPLTMFIGFCYDSYVDDYKCVMIDNDTRNPHIFSSKLNSWRTNLGSSDKGKIKRGENGFDYNNIGVALDRSIYWLVDISNIIVEFDLEDEEFIEFPLPSEMPKSQLFMTVLGGSLCITNSCYENEEVEMWLMSKEGNKNKCCCWSKLLKVNIYGFRYFKVRPLSFMQDGKILCRMEYKLEDNSLILTDPKTKSIEDFIIHHDAGHDWLEQFNFEAHHMGYTESLVSPN